MNFRSAKKTERCLKDISETSSRIRQITIFVDNSPRNKQVNKIKNKNIIVFYNHENLGYAGGNNVGIRYALSHGADFIFILNPDTHIEKNTLPELLKVINQDKKIGIVGPKIYSMDKKIWSAGGIIDKNRYTAGLIGLGEKDSGQYDQVKKVDFISGTAILIRKEVFERIGLLEEKYFLYYEDVDFCLRAQKAGFDVVFVPKSTIFHEVSSSVGKNSPTKEYYMARNHLLFMEKWAPWPIKLREMLRMPKTLYEHQQGGERYALLGIKDYFLRKFRRQDIS